MPPVQLKTFMLVSPSQRGDLPVWSWEPSANGRIAAHANEVRQMLGLATHFHEINQTIADFEARKASGVTPPAPVLPNNTARLAKAEQARLQAQAMKQRIADTIAKSLTEREALQPFDFRPDGADMRRELRDYARTITAKQRLDLINTDPSFAEAVAERPPYLSGTMKSDWDQLRRTALERRYGPRLEQLSAEISAGERALLLHRTLSTAIENEITASGGELKPEGEPAAAQWDLVRDAGTELS